MDKLLRNKTAIFIFVAPALILFTVVLFIPIGTSFYYALCTYDRTTRSYSFIGLGNFQKMLTDPNMRIALKNSLFFLLFSCISQLIMGLLLAGLLTNIKKGRNLFKNVIYMPCVLSRPQPSDFCGHSCFTPKSVSTTFSPISALKDPPGCIRPRDLSPCLCG